MILIVSDTYQELSLKGAEIAATFINENNKAGKESLISFPGGDTPLGLVNEFAALVNTKKADISRCRYVQLDEWVGLGEEDKGSCAYFNRINLLNKIKYNFLEYLLINGRADGEGGIAGECKKLDDFISRFGPLDLSVLGIGLNGHLGFNEEGADPKDGAHSTPLSKTTKKVMSKYFEKEHKLEYGITQGLGQIMAAKKVLLIANGGHKAKILKKAFKGPVDTSVPASILQTHKACFVLADREAAALL